MIRAIRPSAMAQDDASLITGWNVSPNVGYTVVLTPGATACGVLLFDADMTALVASGAGLVGTGQPVILLPQTGQTIGMVDADLGWHLLLTTTGTEAQQTIRIGPAVDLPDEIHPIYTDDDMALARATAAINAGASYVDDVTVTCPLGLGAGMEDVVSVPIDGVAVVGQVESITWTATPDGATTQAVIRRHTAIASEAPIAPPTPPTVADDAAETDASTATSGNVLTNDDSGLTVSAVSGLSANVGQIVAGNNGGEFVIGVDGAWTFDPSSAFATLVGAETATTSATYHASNGAAESMATLTVTVTASEDGDQYWGNVALYVPMTGADGSTVFADIKGHTITRYSPAIISAGDGPQDTASFGRCNVSSSGAAFRALAVVGSDSLHVGAGDFCVDFFVKFNATPNMTYFSPVFFAKRYASTNFEIVLAYLAGALRIYASTTGADFPNPIPATLWAPTIGEWHYIRLNRSGNTWRLYVDANKVAQADWANAVYAGSAPITIIGDGANAMVSDISMSHFRLTIGAARETADIISVPPLPYPVG